MTSVAFTVIGKPEPRGSKNAFRTKSGRMVVSDNNPNSGPWMGVVAAAASAEMGEASLLDGALGLVVVFTVRRPQGHFGSGKNADKLKPSAPPFPTTRPDTTKLLRGVEDALSGVVWRDDAQVVEQTATKRYGAPEGAQILVWTK